MIRMCYILKIIQQYSLKHQFLSAKYILEKLTTDYQINCDIKTIYADIDKINILFKEVFHIENYIQSKHKKGYYIYEDVLNDGELRFIYDTILSSYAISGLEKKELFEKISVLSSSTQIQRLNLSSFKKNNDLPLFTKLNTILKAIDTQKNIAFEYIRPQLNAQGQLVKIKSTNGNYKNQITTYMVSPYEVVMDLGRYYLLAYNNKRSMQLSIYRIDRMDLVRTVNEPYQEIREMFDMEQTKAQAVNMFFSSEINDIEFVFNPSILANVLDQFGESIQLEKDNLGKIKALVKEVTISDGLVGWIMMLGDNITILAPLSLKEKVMNRLQLSLNNYII